MGDGTTAAAAEKETGTAIPTPTTVHVNCEGGTELIITYFTILVVADMLDIFSFGLCKLQLYLQIYSGIVKRTCMCFLSNE